MIQNFHFKFRNHFFRFKFRFFDSNYKFTFFDSNYFRALQGFRHFSLILRVILIISGFFIPFKISNLYWVTLSGNLISNPLNLLDLNLDLDFKKSRVSP